MSTYLLDYGTVTGSATATHNLTLYRAPSGALVFGAGTVYWAWGLDANHDLEATPVDPRVKQAMVNLLADMGDSARHAGGRTGVGNPVDGYHKAGVHHHRAE